MTIFQHKVPANLFGISPVANAVQQTFIVHDVQRAIYAQINASGAATMIGYIPATSDNQGGIAQLARGVDINYNSAQSTSGFGASVTTGGVITVTYPSMSIMWAGSVQPITAGTFTQSAGTATYSFGVSYNWGLTQFSLFVVDTTFPQGYIELCQIQVNVSGATATILGARINGVFMGNIGVPPQGSSAVTNGIPVSGATGAMAW